MYIKNIEVGNGFLLNTGSTYGDNILSYNLKCTDDTDSCILFSVGIGSLYYCNLNFLVYSNDLFIEIGDYSYFPDSVGIGKIDFDLCKSQDKDGDVFEVKFYRNGCVRFYLPCKKRKDIRSIHKDLIRIINNLDDSIDSVDISLVQHSCLSYIPDNVCAVVDGVLTTDVGDVSELAGEVICEASKQNGIDEGDICNFEEMGMMDKLSFIDGIEPKLRVGEWHESPNGVLYCAGRSSFGATLCFILDMPVLSARGIELYRDMFCGVVRKNRSGSVSIAQVNKIGSYLDSSKKADILDNFQDIDFIINGRSVASEENGREMLKTGYSYKKFYITEVLDGLNMLTIRFYFEELNILYEFSVNKSTKRLMPVDVPISCSKNDMLGMLKSISLKDKDILKSIKYSKFVVYNYNGEDIEIDENTAVDTCYCFSDCIEVCKKRKGKKFLVVEFTEKSIGSQWELMVLSSKCHIIKKLA